MYYYAHHLGGNRNQRDKYKGHKYYKDTVDFCENWDQKSFDPNFKSLSLKEFEPFVKKYFLGNLIRNKIYIFYLLGKPEFFHPIFSEFPKKPSEIFTQL